ncbi:MAG: HAD-IIIA family hydrolase [Kiritimatiellae bacterium]|nr:HAD-IIIA family hydrolase [Kiritimatiellia bacterium]
MSAPKTIVPAASGRKCVFFDRDGIVNKSPGPGRYVTRWKDFRLIPEFPVCLRTVLQLGYQAALVTNQRAVARGLMSINDLEDIHRRLRRLLMSRYGLELLEIAYCPHNVHECSCRKPQPGMLLALAAKYHLDLAASWMIGDSETDVEAGRRAGCRTVLVAGRAGGTRADERAASMRALAKKISRIIRP